MKINQIIINEMTTAGAVATVAKPMGETQKRPEVAGLKPVDKIGKAKKKGPYANSLVEGAMKDLDIQRQDYQRMTPQQFFAAYKMTKQQWLAKNKQLLQKPVQEAELQEDDLILIPGQGMTRRTGFVKHDPDKAEHEGQTLKNSLHTIIRVATHLNKELSTQDNFPEWVSEKVGAVKHMMVTVMDYLISNREMNGRITSNETGGVIAGGGVGEGVAENQQPARPTNPPQPVKKKPMTPFGPGQQKVDEKFASQQQAKLMYATAGGADTGVSKKVAKEFIKKSHGQKVSKLPKKVKKD